MTAARLDDDPPPDERAGGEGQPVIIRTKLQPPLRVADVVIRSRLHDQLARGAGRRLTLVSAPAGFGKSTLLSGWHNAVQDRPVAWLSIDPADDDPIVLWAHLIESLGDTVPAFKGQAMKALLAGAPLPDVVLPTMVNELHEAGQCALVLDDFHRLSREASRQSVLWLVEHAPPTLQLVVSTRSDPAFPLGAMRAHGDLVEIRAADLRFTTDEAEALLNDKLAIALEGEDIDVLVERTEGWATGLYLAALTLRGAPDRHAFVHSFSGSNSHVVDFLSSEVLSAHEPGVQEFMLLTSVLERMTGPLCDAVLRRVGSAAVLDGLARSNMFLVPLDDRRGWYRFHHLFAQLLRVELERRRPGLAPILLERAADWHLAMGSADEAIEYYIAAGRFEQATSVIASKWSTYVEANRPASVLAWLRRLPGDLLASDTRMLLVKAWVLSADHRHEEAVDAIVQAAIAPGEDDGPLPDGLSTVQSSLVMLRAVFTRGDVGAALKAASRAVELESASSPWRAVACWALGLQLYRSDRLEEADCWLQEAAVRAPGSQHRLCGCLALATLSLIAGRGSRLAEQQRLAERAEALSVEWGLADAAGEAHYALAASLASRGSYAEAVPLFERGVEAVRRRREPLVSVEGLLQFASAAIAARDRARAESLVQEAIARVAECPDPGALGRRAQELTAILNQRPDKTGQNEKLSQRERAVLRLLAGGLPEREIGRELYLSFNTIHSHTKAIYRKLGVSSRSDALGRAKVLGIL